MNTNNTPSGLSIKLLSYKILSTIISTFWNSHEKYTHIKMYIHKDIYIYVINWAISWKKKIVQNQPLILNVNDNVVNVGV